MAIPFFLFFFTFAFYLRTTCATFYIEDSGEIITACDRLAIAHSPSYPLFTLLGRIGCLLPLGQPMLRVTLCSSLMAALSVVMVYLLLKMIFKGIFAPSESVGSVTREWEVKSWAWVTPSLFGALVFAFSSEQWFHAGGAKSGIYVLNTLITVGLLYLLIKMRENGWFLKSFFLASFFYGLGLANHWPQQVVLTPAYFWLFLAGQKRVPYTEIKRSILSPFDLIKNIRIIFSGVGLPNLTRALLFWLLTFSVYFYLPIRSVQNPVLNWWNPRTFSGFLGTIMRESYKGMGGEWGWPMISRNAGQFWICAWHQYGGLFTPFVFLFSVLGFIWLCKRKQAATAIGILLFGGGVGTGVIFIFRSVEGNQYALDNFFTLVFLAFSILASAGIAGFGNWILSLWPNRLTMCAIPSFALLLALIPLTLNFKISDQSHYICSYDEGINMLRTVNSNGVILCNGDIDVHPLWYLQFVEGKRPEIASFTLQVIHNDWYRDSLFKRWPFLKISLGRELTDETMIQKMIDIHAQERSFYFTNIAMPPWLSMNNPCVPDGILWRIYKTRNLDYPFQIARLNRLWSGYRLRYMDPPERGYWDEFTDLVRGYYGVALEYTGFSAAKNQMHDAAIWSYEKALPFSQSPNIGGIYVMEGESYLALGKASEAVQKYQEGIKRDPPNPYVYAKLGDAYLGAKDIQAAKAAFQTALTLNPNQKEALEGMQQLAKMK